MTSLLVGSRKGLFVLESNAITAHHFQGEPVTQVLVNPHDQSWLVALNLGHFGVKLHKSTKPGRRWLRLRFLPSLRLVMLISTISKTTPSRGMWSWFGHLPLAAQMSLTPCGRAACQRVCSNLPTADKAGR
jgi:hypothetical protein